MQLLGSIIYLTSAFYSFEGASYLVHWTHSFLYLHNSAGFPVLQDGMIHKNERQKLEKLRMDMGLQIWHTGYVGVQMGTAFWRLPFFIACVPDKTISGLLSLHPAALFS